MNDAIKYNDTDHKGNGYRVKVGKDKLEGILPVPEGGRLSNKTFIAPSFDCNLLFFLKNFN